VVLLVVVVVIVLTAVTWKEEEEKVGNGSPEQFPNWVRVQHDKGGKHGEGWESDWFGQASASTVQFLLC